MNYMTNWSNDVNLLVYMRYSPNECKVDLDLGKVVIQMINTSSKTFKAMLKTYKTC